MTYADMPAGPELDRLVAEKVMGWKPEHHETYTLYSPSGRVVEESASNNEWWSPSQEIAHAWDVIDSEAFTDPDGFRRTYFQITEAPLGWKVSILHKMDDRRLSTDVIAMAETAPLAICRAALVAIT